MYPPPPTEVLSKLKGCSAETLSFGRYVAHLLFENGHRLTFSAPFRFAHEDVIANAAVCEFPLCESTLLRLLGQSVDEIMCDADGTLDLTFGNHDRLIIYANDPMYEAYTLLIEGQKFVV